MDGFHNGYLIIVSMLHSVYLYSTSVWFDNNLHIQYSIQFKYYVKFTNVPELYILFVILSINMWIKKKVVFTFFDTRIGFEKWRKCWKKWEKNFCDFIWGIKVVQNWHLVELKGLMFFCCERFMSRERRERPCLRLHCHQPEK